MQRSYATKCSDSLNLLKLGKKLANESLKFQKITQSEGSLITSS